MLDYKQIKKLAKERGYRVQSLAESVGYSYAGFLKAINEGTLKYYSRRKLAEILEVHPDEIYIAEADISNLVNEPSYEYQKTQENLNESQMISQLLQQLTSEVAELKYENKVLRELLDANGINYKKTGT